MDELEESVSVLGRTFWKALGKEMLYYRKVRVNTWLFETNRFMCAYFYPYWRN